MSSPRGRFLSLQFGRFYLIIIGFLSLFILILSIVSLINQSQVAHSFSLKEISIRGEMLAVQLERRTWQLAEACLNDPELSTALTGQEISGNLLAALAKRHPIAEHFFFLQDSSLRFPLLSTPAPRRPFSYPGNLPAKQQFYTLFYAAEANATRGMYDRAIAGYEKCGAMAVPDQWKAEAFLRLARCYAAAKRPTNALRIYERLGRNYGDYIDDYYRPYAMTAALEADGLKQNSAGVSKDLQTVYHDLIEGRWQLSAEATEQLKSELERHLGIVLPAEKTRYLKQFDEARVVANELQRVGAKPNEIFSRVVGTKLVSEIFGVLLPDKAGSRKILAFSVDLEYVGGPLLIECKRSLAANEVSVPVFEIRSKTSEASTGLNLPFLSIFKFLELHLPESAVNAGKRATRVEIWLAAGSAVLMASLLCMIVILLQRVSREINSLQVRTDFLSHVSHELKTPLTLILLYCETLLRDDQLDYDQRRGCYQVIAREGERLKRLIGNLLHLSRIAKAKPEQQIVEGDMAVAVEKTVRTCEGWLSSMGLEVSLNIAPELPPVRFDSERVSQALMNLLENAGKYSDESKKADIRLYSEGSSVILEVRDQGRGIPAGEQGKVFEEFYRAANTGEESGAGLGLYLVRETMQAHGGSVELESEEGEGSRFRLIFPSCAPMQARSKDFLHRSIFEKTGS